MSELVSLREFGGPRRVALDAREVAELERRSDALRTSLKLRGAPFTIVSRTPARVSTRYVAGFVSVGSAHVEIVPKFLQGGAGPDWRNAFLNVLIRLGKLTALPPALGGRSTASLPDLMGVVLLDGLTRAQSEGMPRRYVERQASLEAVRGRIDVERLWRRRLDPTRIPCRFDEFSEDTPATRLLKWAAAELSRSVSAPWLAGELAAAGVLWPSVPPLLPEPRVLANLRIAPQFQYLEPAIELAKLLAEGRSLSLTRSDSATARAFLWNTERIFEDFAFAVFQQAARRLGADAEKAPVPLADGERPLAEDGRPYGPRPQAIPTIPDIRITRNGRTLTLLDAKYKDLGARPASSDTYQVMAGGRVLGCTDVALLYPDTSTFGSIRTWKVRGGGLPVRVHAAPLDLLRMSEPGGFAHLVEDAARLLNDLVASRRPLARSGRVARSAAG